MRGARTTTGVLAIGLVVALSACGGDDGAGGAPTPNAKATSTVAVTVQEFSVLPGQASAPAGTVTFNVTNKGPNDDHEFVVVRSDLAPESLPVKADGSVDEEGAGVQSLGEIAEFSPGQSKSVTFEMTAGKYVLFCNVVDTEENPPEVHYKLGMRTAFTVV